MVKLRKFLLADLDQVAEINSDSFSTPWTKTYFKKVYERNSDNFAVAESERKVVGYVIWQISEGMGWIKSLAVTPNSRMEGVGKSLLIFAFEQLKKSGTKEVFAHVRTGNAAGIAFYQYSGFKIANSIKKYYRNGDDAYLVKKEI